MSAATAVAMCYCSVHLELNNKQIVFCRRHRIFGLKCALLLNINMHGMMLNYLIYEMKNNIFWDWGTMLPPLYTTAYKYQGKDKFVFVMISGHRDHSKEALQFPPATSANLNKALASEFFQTPSWLPWEVFSHTANTVRESVPRQPPSHHMHIL